MTTIFNSSYLDTLRRIDAKAKDAPNGESSSAPRTFSEILSERTKPQQVIPAEGRASLSPDLTPQEESISNLTPIENLRLESVPEPQRLNNNNVPVPAPRNVAPAPLLPQSAIQETGRAPQAPKVLTARRVSTPLQEITPQKQSITTPIVSKTSREAFLEQLITEAGRKHGVDPVLSIAVARAESSLRVDAVSKDGHASKGIFQLLDSTGRELMGRMDVKGAYDPFDPKLNTHLGVGYLRRLHDLFSRESNLGFNLRTSPANSAADLEKVAVAAFNAGEGNVARAQRIAKSLGKDPGSYAAIEPHLPASTRAYVNRVGSLKDRINTFSDEETLA